jgi:hypothetical protein
MRLLQRTIKGLVGRQGSLTICSWQVVQLLAVQVEGSRSNHAFVGKNYWHGCCRG